MRSPMLTGVFVCLASVGWADEGFKVTVKLQSSSPMSGKAIEFPATGEAEIDGHLVEIKLGAETGRHKHPFPAALDWVI